MTWLDLVNFFLPKVAQGLPIRYPKTRWRYAPPLAKKPQGCTPPPCAGEGITSHGWGISARAHVQTSLLYLRNGSADWVQFWCVSWESWTRCLTRAPLGGGAISSSPRFLAISSKPMQVSSPNLQYPLSQQFYTLCWNFKVQGIIFRPQMTSEWRHVPPIYTENKDLRESLPRHSGDFSI